MKRPHRRIHLMIWWLIAPATLAAGIVAWLQRPQTPFTELPTSIETLDHDAE